MKISVIGTGYVGLVSGTCFAEFGISVTCVDKDVHKIERLKNGEVPIYEPGLESLIESNVAKGRLNFTTDLASSVKESDVVFIAVGTPMSDTGEADLTHVFQVAEEIALNMEGYTVIVTKSTVPVDTGMKLTRHIDHLNPQGTFDMVSNPEFLREGSAIEDFMRPNRVVIGSYSEKATEIMRRLYRPLYLLETPIVVTSLESAELIKYASNAFLATKVAFINEMADLCEKCGADIQDVSKGMGLDQRIGKKFLHAGPGYGGSCFPKDTLALLRTSQSFKVPSKIVEAVVESNTSRKRKMASKILEMCDGEGVGKKIALLGLTFKPNTDDMRDAPALDIIPALQRQGAEIHAFDPQGMEAAKPLLPDVMWHEDAYTALKGSDVLVILTEWNEFRALDLNRVKSLMVSPLIVDFRNIYDIQELQNQGIRYVSIGRPSANSSPELDSKTHTGYGI